MTKSEQLQYLQQELDELESVRSVQEASGHTDEALETGDMIAITRRSIQFLQGGGFEVTLRVMPMPWDDPNPANWDWSALLDRETVTLLTCKSLTNLVNS